MKTSIVFVGLFTLIGLGCSSRPTTTTSVASTTHSLGAFDSVDTSYESPGGMWMPSQLPAQSNILKSLGLKLNVNELANPLEAPLGAVVSLGGCSASFVSPEGLIITNHHCVRGSLQYHSTPDKNYVTDGFLAKTRDEEKWNGPSAKIWVTQRQSDITEQILKGSRQIKNDTKRYQAIESQKKSIITACEKDKPATRCKIASYFQGAEFHLIEMMEISDVRLVYAPHEGIGNYGGDIDNWMWPRHTGDYSFYRAYVGKNGNPAPFSKDNVPYRPKHFLKVASKGISNGDFVMVAGYPGRTYRHATSFEVQRAIEWSYPTNLTKFNELLKILEALKSDEAKIKAQSWIGGINNRLKNYGGMLDGLVKGGLADQKKQQERALSEWIDADPERKTKYSGILEKLSALEQEKTAYQELDGSLGELEWSELIRSAVVLVRMAEERTKPDTKRKPLYQERNWKRLLARQVSMSKSYASEKDQAVLTWTLKRVAMEKSSDKMIAPLFGLKTLDGADHDAIVSQLFASSKLGDENYRVKLFNKATTASLKKGNDSIIKLALKLVPLIKKQEAREDAWDGRDTLLKPIYIAALREFTDGELAPDANSTLRVSYGTVQGYTPPASSTPYSPFTTLSELVAKHKGTFPFDAPAPLLAAAKEKKFGAYKVDSLNDVPVDFLANLDITGGNSGSATLNSKGELVGVVFDGNLESVASDWLFMPEITRSIHCDIRFILWVMEHVDGAGHLVNEMVISDGPLSL